MSTTIVQDTGNAVVGALRAAVADPARVKTRALDLHANAHDASHFLLIPQAVVVAQDAAEVGALLRTGAEQGVHLTFRSGGTSLSGQAVTDGVLVDVRRNFKDIEVLDDGLRVRVQPGVVVRALNSRLAKYGRKFGPDPASESAATIGGVVANNSSGMACGTVDNTYQTLESVTVVLPSGTVVDTGAADADERLLEREPVLYRGLLELSRRTRDNAASAATIRQQFSMKNTMGYGVNSLLDFDRPVDMLAHLIVGSEGTLGFVAEAVFCTVPKLPHVTTALLIFPGLEAATAALPALVATGAATLELMDALSLTVGQQMPGAPAIVLDLVVEEHAALLVEYHAESAEKLTIMLETGLRTVDTLGLTLPADFTTDATIRGQLWYLRKGIIPAVGGTRPQGTNALLEDIVVPVPALARTCMELMRLFAKYEYENCMIFGHAKDGNVHFMLTDDFGSPVGLERFSKFTEDLVDLVLAEGGSLKAEHGTGRVMAPYVERQFGSELYDVMRRIKALFDPTGMLNPGVLINDDPAAHLKDLKAIPAVAKEVDRCTECGWCEPVCPSRNVTLTPRQRIVSLRAIEQARLDGNLALVAEMEKDYEYDAVQTCAADGMCQTACPVTINTGDLMKRLRHDQTKPLESALWNVAAGNWGTVTRGAALALTAVASVPVPLVLGPNRLARTVLGTDAVPLYSPDLPGGGRTRHARKETSHD
ncbi:D-lactate dehydrogenase [Cryobacterium roopkundense]|uniref:D-lactate dehydrogenase (cytochrome) n=1 Tax=Cryobacterium roopkundense TaxID=1001240 RepID=A0A7W9E339_9MICO|nr:D-lactate dehydrogenase [Cryobacterium roopkundense]